MKPFFKPTPHVLVALCLVAAFLASAAAPWQQADDPTPPTQPVKLIFIHHSSGENWLADDNGGLGIALGQNNYFVSGTNYGWGPDAIGDRTDIPNWTEWFRSANTERTMQAVYNESGQNSAFTRTLADPGGENQVIMFKSCFPNSMLEGNPDDPPKDYEEMSVGGAKYVYNQILPYFAAHPEKLFIVITAPPVQDSTYSKNARAFNEWLVNDWLRENNFTGSNVAVFDFYNVLTGPDNHHRYSNGQIEHVFKTGKNTAYYPSEDDHPSSKGNRKATEEFVPLLNIFYHRWKASAPAQPAAATQPAATAAPAATDLPATAAPAPALANGLVDDFEGSSPAGSAGWVAFWDEATSTKIQCGPAGDTVHTGAGALALDFNIVANSWATCALMFDTPQDWSAGAGLALYLRAGEAAQGVDVDLYTGTDNRATYIYKIEPGETDWQLVQIKWADFHRADWEENAGAAFDSPQAVTGLAFGFGTPPDMAGVGQVWVDDIQLLGSAAPQAEATAMEAPPQPQTGDTPVAAPQQPQATETDKKGGGLPCAGSAALPLGFLLLAWVLRLRAR